ncbi:hypothetical protein HMPREF3164_06760 [Rothia sp. HMSC08A08]|nr:hypothetical protein HMPREF3164_06760 [Rothia sp. HMSC08A08]
MPQGFIGFVGGSGFDAAGRYEYLAEPKNPGRGVRTSGYINRRYFRVLGESRRVLGDSYQRIAVPKTLQID